MGVWRSVTGWLCLVLLLFSHSPALGQATTADRIKKQFEVPPGPKSGVEPSALTPVQVYCEAFPTAAPSWWPGTPEGERAVPPEEVEQKFLMHGGFWASVLGEDEEQKGSVPCDLLAPPAGAEEIRFVLSRVLFEGATVYVDAEFLPLYEDRLGKDVALADVYRLAIAITAMYRGDGYILTQAFVPEQRIRDGIVRVQVVEGFINEVIIDGKIAGRESLLEAFARKITASRPLHADTLERYLLLADDLPGMTAKAVLTPSADLAGASDLILFVEHKSIGQSYRFDNRGNRFVGPFYGTAELRLNSILGLYEQTSLRGIFATESEEMRFFEVTHEERLGSDGATLSMSYSLTRSRPGFALERQNAESDHQELAFTLAYPLIRRRDENLSARGTFVWQKTLSDLNNLALFDDRLRILRGAVTYDFVDRFRGLNLIEVEASQGLDIFNESTSGSNDGVDPELSRANGKSNFFKVTAYASRLQSLAILVPGLNVLGVVTGQFSGSQLLSAEEFGFGGEFFGRAYDSSEIVGDHGVAGKIEVQYGRSPVWEFLTDYQVYAYYDFGMVWRINATDQGTNGKVTESAASAGLGLRFNVTDNVSGYIEIDKPLTRAVSAEGSDDAGEPRVFFRLSAKF